MNPLNWEALQTLRRSLDPSHQNDVNNSMENARRTNNVRDAFHECSRHSDEPQSSTEENVGLRGVPPLHKICIKGSEVQEPDGQPLEMDNEDPELTRKRKELQDIEERILFKKAAIALKTVEPDFSCNVQSATRKGVTLKDRVNAILQQRHPASFLSKVRSPRERRNSYSLSKDGVLQDDHPLKLRVKVLMEQRSRDRLVSSASGEVPDVTPRPPSRSAPSPAKEENGVDKGFQRFLSVLNKGVDMDFLSRIVNDDNVDLPLGEELLNIQPCVPENSSSTPVRRERKRSNSGASLPGCTRSTSRERNTDLPSQETSLNERLSPPDDDEKQKHRGDGRFGSGSRSKSPLAVKKKKEEEKPKVDQQHEQLQNILKTLGLSLEVEEMSKLADRTQERLYGKKQEDRIADSKGEQETQQRDSQRHFSDSSSSSSSSSSRSASRSCSPRNKDSLTRQDSDHNKEAKRYSDKDEEHYKETFDYRHPYPQNQMYPHTPPAAFSAYPNYSLSQVSEYSAHSNIYNSSYWTHTQGTHHPSLYHRGFPYPQNTYHHFAGPEVAPNMAYPHHSFVHMNSFMNPDPYMSEGHSRSGSDPRCWQFISTNEQNTGQVKQGKKKQKKWNAQTKALNAFLRSSEIRKGNNVQQRPNLVSVKCERPRLKKNDSKAKEPECLPPGEEIQVNPRKTICGVSSRLT